MSTRGPISDRAPRRVLAASGLLLRSKAGSFQCPGGGDSCSGRGSACQSLFSILNAGDCTLSKLSPNVFVLVYVFQDEQVLLRRPFFLLLLITRVDASPVLLALGHGSIGHEFCDALPVLLIGLAELSQPRILVRRPDLDLAFLKLFDS